MATSMVQQIAGVAVRLATPGYALAMKLAAWQGRGRQDPMGSQDFEDVIALLDGCEALPASVRQLPAAEQLDVAAELRRILALPDIWSYVQGMVPQPASPARVANCLTKLGRIAESAQRVDFVDSRP